MSNMPAMTMAEALGSMPAFIFDSMGEKTLKHCLAKAGLSASLLEVQNGYVPEISIGKLLEAAARKSGETNFGLHLVPIYSIHEYGMWGEYIVSAPNLNSAISRAISTIGIHASGDVLLMKLCNGNVHFKYIFEERTSTGYDNVAFAAAAAVLSVPQHFMRPGWRPSYIGLDIKRPRSTSAIEDTYQCPVLFDHDCIEVVFPEIYLAAKNPKIHAKSAITVSDLIEEYHGGPPAGYEQVVASVIRFHLSTGVIGLDQAANALDVSLRTMQRRLAVEGTDFKTLVRSVRMQRAKELLTGSDQNMLEISMLLGYSSPSHFSRAFKKIIGVVPSKFTKNMPKRIQ